MAAVKQECASDRHCFNKLASTGAFLSKWGSVGIIAVDGSGNVFVAENPNDRIQKCAFP